MLARLVIMELNKTYQEYSHKIIICYKQRVKYRGETVSVTEVWSLNVLTDTQDIPTHGFPQELQDGQTKVQAQKRSRVASWCSSSGCFLVVF